MKFTQTTRLTALAIGAMSLAFAGCLSGNTAADAESPRPGQLRLVSMNGLAKATASASGTSVFTLDTTRTSHQQYFILQNTGDEDVTDIVFATDNPNFTFSPSRIAVLPPSAGASVIQVIKLNVVHGKLLDAVGQGTYLPMGPVAVSASVSGVKDSAGSEIAVGETVTLNSYVKVARIEIGEVGGTSGTLDQFKYGMIMSPVLGFPFRSYYVVIDSTGGHNNPDLFLKNTGNVALMIERRSTSSSLAFELIDSLVLAPDSLIVFKSGVFRVDAGGTAFAPWQTPVESDGKVLLALYPDLEDLTPEEE